jgi:hypothetical protein
MFIKNLKSESRQDPFLQLQTSKNILLTLKKVPCLLNVDLGSTSNQSTVWFFCQPYYGNMPLDEASTIKKKVCMFPQFLRCKIFDIFIFFSIPAHI